LNACKRLSALDQPSNSRSLQVGLGPGWPSSGNQSFTSEKPTYQYLSAQLAVALSKHPESKPRSTPKCVFHNQHAHATPPRRALSASWRAKTNRGTVKSRQR